MESLQALWNSIDWQMLGNLVSRVLAVFLCLTVHETCHGLAAYALGDPTAKRQHRLSFNPLRHIDWLGFASMLIVGFGWAKPVHIDPRYYKDAKTGIVWTAFAGPLMNFIIAFVAIFLFNLLLKVPVSIFSSEIMTRIFIYLIYLMQYTALISLGQAIFNLIPLPPLDGSKILYGVLPDSVYFNIMKYENWLSLILFLVLFSGVLNGPLVSIRTIIFDGMNNLCALVL